MARAGLRSISCRRFSECFVGHLVQSSEATGIRIPYLSTPVLMPLLVGAPSHWSACLRVIQRDSLLSGHTFQDCSLGQAK